MYNYYVYLSVNGFLVTLYCSESFLNVLLMLNVIYLRHTVLIYIVHQCGLTALRQL